MLDELKKLKYNGGKDGLLFFLCDVVGLKKISVRDAEVICSHAPGKRHLSAEDMVSYCLTFGWINISDEVIFISPFLSTHASDKDALNNELILSTVGQLFANEVLKPDLFYYDVVQSCYSFKNELLPLCFSVVRNVLISQGFLITARNNNGTKFYIAPRFETVVANHCIAKRRNLSLDKLKKQIENNEIAGEKAELFVESFEKKRLGYPRSEEVRRISEIDVSAGYDIVSYNSNQSQRPDRFIEVKAISGSGFFWSRNEYEIAKLKGDMYFLYLVELGRISEPGYIPEIIQDPAVNVIGSDGWYVEAQSYHITHV